MLDRLTDCTQEYFNSFATPDMLAEVAQLPGQAVHNACTSHHEVRAMALCLACKAC